MKADELRREDEAARALARTRFDAPLALEAGAGTGKTAALVARVVTWVLTGGWERARLALGESAPEVAVAARALERVVLVTFTEKAMVEMEQRVTEALRALAQGGDVVGLPVRELGLSRQALGPRTAALLDASERLAVRTIHGFASSLLSRHALAAGLHPAFKVDADGSLLRATCAEVVADALPRALGERPQPAWLALLELGPGPQEVLEALRVLVGARVTGAELARDPYPDERLSALARATALRAGELAELLLEALPETPNRNHAKAAAVAEALADLALPLAGVRKAEDLPRDLALDVEVAARLRKYASGDFTGTEAKFLGESGVRVPALAAGLAEDLALLAAIDVPLARASREVLVPLLEEARSRLRARGVLTFEDLLAGARDLLRDVPAVRRAVRAQIDQLLVDEFQDTDAVQCEIVRWIALDGPREERPGLFLVGDPKQSIYGWRSADLAAYEDMLAALEREGGSCARLSVNYRSSQAVLDEVQRLIEPSMQHVAGLQPAFQPLLEGRKPKPAPAVLFAEGRRAVEHWSCAAPGAEAGRTSADAARRFEARSIAGELARLAAGGVQLERCALLLRSTTHQEPYLEALREAGVPYSVGKDKGYFRTREVVDAVALVSCLLDPTDALALAVFLRSPVCGVPDAALAPLWRGGLPELAARLDGESPAPLEQAVALLARAEVEARAALEAVSPGGAHVLQRVEGWRLCAESGLRTLDGLRGELARSSVDRVVERLRACLCPEVGEAARFPGAHRLANLEYFFATLVETLATAGGGAAGVLRELRAGLAGERVARSAPPDDVGEGALRILTVHSAKGLQFQAVWLADLHHAGGSGPGELPARVERLGAACEIELFGSPSLERRQLDEHRDAVAAAESVRLLYVAATRAEDRLVLGGLTGDPSKANTLADVVARRAGAPQAWDQLETAWTESARSELESDGARFVLAAARAPEAAEASAHERPAAPAKLDLRALENTRQRAAAHAARPFHAAISSSERVRERARRELQERPSRRDRELSRVLGVALHVALERWPVGQANAHAIARAALAAELGARCEAAQLASATAEANALLDAFANSQLARRLDGLAGRFHARELALLLPAGDAREGPVSAWVGAADLVHEEDGGLVVVDFKTDQGVDDAQLIETYRPQLALYARALRQALARPVLRGELWRVGEGRALTVPLD